MAKNIDLGTLINADMYYDYSYDILKGSKGNSNTLQHTCVDNVLAPPARTFPLQESTEEEEKKSRGLGESVISPQNQIISSVPGFVRLNPNVKYDRISVQMGNYRVNGDRQRYRRSNVYVSLKESTEQHFNVFLTGAATNAKSELYRGCKNSQAVKDIIDALFSKYPDVMIARLRYKPVDGYITDFHKKNTKSAILGLHQNVDGDFIATLVLYYELIEIPLTMPLSEKQKGMYYAHGVYDDYQEFDDEL
jgi:hypothetical protein